MAYRPSSQAYWTWKYPTDPVGKAYLSLFLRGWDRGNVDCGAGILQFPGGISFEQGELEVGLGAKSLILIGQIRRRPSTMKGMQMYVSNK